MSYQMRQLLFNLTFGGLLAFSFNTHAALSDITQIYQQTPAVHGFNVCVGGGCAEVKNVSLTDAEWRIVTDIFTHAGQTNAEQERGLIALAVGAMEKIVGDETDTATDRAGTFGNSNYPGQLDCNDEAINSTTYMRLMRQNRLIKLHEVEDMRTRNFFFSGWPHSTAVIHEVATGNRFAVDSWFYDNGFPATVVPFSKWKSGYIPADSPVLKK